MTDTDKQVEVVKQTLARYALALGADWGDTGLWRDKEKAEAAISSLERTLKEQGGRIEHLTALAAERAAEILRLGDPPHD